MACAPWPRHEGLCRARTRCSRQVLPAIAMAGSSPHFVQHMGLPQLAQPTSAMSELITISTQKAPDRSPDRSPVRPETLEYPQMGCATTCGGPVRQKPKPRQTDDARVPPPLGAKPDGTSPPVRMSAVEAEKFRALSDESAIFLEWSHDLRRDSTGV